MFKLLNYDHYQVSNLKKIQFNYSLKATDIFKRNNNLIEYLSNIIRMKH